VWRVAGYGNLVEIEVSEGDIQLAEAGAVSLLRPWLQRWQVIVGEAFKSLLVGSAATATTVEPVMLIEELSEELLSRGFRGGAGGSPDLLPLPLVDTCLVLNIQRLARNRIFASKMNWLDGATTTVRPS
jgi:hypothetical protein